MSNTKTATSKSKVQIVDPIWEQIRSEADAAMKTEPALGSFIFATILSHQMLEDAVCHRLAQRLNHTDVDAGLISQTFQSVLAEQPGLGAIFRADLQAVYDRDPACTRYLDPLLYYKGFHALVTYRFAHALWKSRRYDFALYLQSQSSRIFAVDIHPAAVFGRGIMAREIVGSTPDELRSVGRTMRAMR